MFNTMNFAYYICLWVLQDVSEDPVDYISTDVIWLMLDVQNVEFDLENNDTNNNVKELCGCFEEYKSNWIDVI